MREVTHAESLANRGAAFLLLAGALLAAQQGAQSAAIPSAPQRGMQTVETEEGPVKNGHRYVVAIGIDHYENWPILGTAVSDATEFAKLLTDKFGFEYGAQPLVEEGVRRRRQGSLLRHQSRALKRAS